MTTTGKVWLGAVIVGALGAATYLFFDDVDAPTIASEISTKQAERDSTQSDVLPTTRVASNSTASSTTEPSTQEGDDDRTFRVDAAGNLILDELTRTNIEALVGLTAPDKLQDAVSEQTKDLSPAAARKAEELVDRFYHYSQAQRESYPPGIAPLTEDDALLQLDGLHALREAHFGREVAEAFYANEEKLSRELVELMRLEKDKSLTMSEKAERAQALHDRLPTVAAIEKKNREPLPEAPNSKEADKKE
jgi:lipase chaperone LimK